MTFAGIETIRVPVGSENVSVAVHRMVGTGPKVLLVHGIGSSSGDFKPIVQGLTTFCKPMLLDLRGHGASDKPRRGYHYSDYVSDLQSVVETLGLEHPIILGHSLGGMVALMWAAETSLAPRGIIIEDSPLRSGVEFRDAFEGWLQLNALPLEAARAWYADRNPHWPEDVVNQRSYDMVNTSRTAIEELQAASLSNQGLDSFEGLGNITAPLLFLQGDPETGSMVHPDDLERLGTLLPQLQTTFFPGAGHTIHRSHPDDWLERVKAFIASLED